MIIDYFSFTSAINKGLIPYKPKAFKRQFTKQEKHKYYKLKKGNKLGNLHKLYHYVFCIMLSNQRNVYAILCLKPTSKIDNSGQPVAFLRIEFNPSKFKSSDYKRLLKRLTTLFGPILAKTLFNEAIVTRHDPAVDLAGYTASTYEFHASGKQISEIIGSVENGITKYLGQRKSTGTDGFYRLYDRPEQLVSKGQQYTASDEHILRIELCNKNRIPLCKLDKQKYPFRSLKCYSHFYDDEYFDQKFIKRCKRHGVSYALHTIKCNKKRRRYIRWLERYEVDLLDHDRYSIQLKKALNKLLKDLGIAKR